MCTTEGDKRLKTSMLANSSAASAPRGVIARGAASPRWAQVLVQAKAVLLTVVWSGVVSLISYKIVDMTIGLRVTEEEEREGLDISSHGETAYNR